MDSVTASTDTDGTKQASESDRLRSRGRRIRALAGVATAILLYLGLSLNFPRTVPRLALLPKPGAARSYTDSCDDGSGGKVTERWELSGPIWAVSTIRLGGDCV